MKILKDIQHWDRRYVLAISLAFVVLIGLTDYLTGDEIALSLFYVFPIALTTWGTSKRHGVVIALVSTLIWLAADIQDGYRYSSPLIHYWNAGIRFGFFMIIVMLLSAFQRAHEQESELARTDSLTTAANSRHFRELLNVEIARSRRYRHPFTVIYLDVDNFKTLNDRFGHSTGDEALVAIVHYAKTNLRQTDAIARLGGDEFAILLTETDEPAAHSTVTKIQKGLNELAQSRQWQITFSLGVLTCLDHTYYPDQVISAADRLMYAVKQNGKNSAVFRTDGGTFPPTPSSLQNHDKHQNLTKQEMDIP